MQLNLPYPIKAKQEELLLEYYLEVLNNRNSASMLRSKYLHCDMLVAREVEPEEKKLEVTVPIITPQVATTVAYLTTTFLGAKEIFPVSTAPDKEEVATAVNTLFKQYARDFSWTRNLILCFKDAAKYDVMAAECCWKQVIIGAATNEIEQQASNKIIKEGFSIKHLDPYNTFWDVSVVPSELSSNGEFAGYIETMSTINLHRFLLTLPVNNGWNHRIKDIKKGGATKYYYTPSITSYKKHDTKVNWETHFNLALNLGATGANKVHEVVTLYCRIIPSDYGLDVPARGTPQVWRLIVVDSQYIVFGECLPNTHDYLPIILGQPSESNLGYQQKSMPEELADIQNMASTLWSAEIKSTRRTVVNREIYNPLLVSKEDINNASDTAKIPLRNSAYGQDINQAIRPLPHTDPALGTRSNLASALTQFAKEVTGQNQVSTGQFIPGNKTNAQFQEVLSKSNARQITMALLLEGQFFAVLKHLLREDLKRFQQPTSAFDADTKSFVDVNMNEINDTQVAFNINDALALDADSPSPDVIMVAMQTIQSVPELAQIYDVGKVFANLMSASGIKHLESYLRQMAPGNQSPIANEEQYKQQMEQALGAINEGTTGGATQGDTGAGVPAK